MYRTPFLNDSEFTGNMSSFAVLLLLYTVKLQKSMNWSLNTNLEVSLVVHAKILFVGQKHSDFGSRFTFFVSDMSS